jgi:hypothetical protein
MYLLYVDESGDIGLSNSPTKYFVLSGLVMHELRWRQILDAIYAFRQSLRSKYHLKLREEIHAAHFIHKPSRVNHISKHSRLLLLRDVLHFEASLQDISILNIVVDKTTKPPTYDVFEKAWMALIQRFENTISYRNFPGPQNPQDYGIVIADNTDEPKLRKLVRKMRHHNPIPNRSGMGFRQVPITTIIEDPIHRNSLHSYFIQLADVNAYFLCQKLNPCRYVQKKGGRNYFDLLNPVLCTVASQSDPQGIVRL